LKEELEILLKKLALGEVAVEEALNELKFLPFKDIFHTKFDTHRELRTGIEEVIFGAGKTFEEIRDISEMLIKNGKQVLITKLQKEKGEKLLDCYPNGEYFPRCGVFTVRKKKKLKGLISVVSAGTSDMPVAEEAAVTAEFFGSKVEKIFDAGVAGIHRLLEYKDKLENSKIIIAVAGMDGALPTVIAGMFGKPVIGVPTSVGYGASFQGVAPLLTMLNACAPGVVTVNIDNGFGAAVFAHKINLM
jgi:NCAIR mutase (PurE)-related protein